MAAAAGGYVFATVLSIWLSRVLPGRAATALMVALLSSFVLYAAAVLWVFAARTAARAWLGLALPVVLFGAWAWLLAPAAS